MSISRKTVKTISDLGTCKKLVTMVETGHARVVKKIIDGNVDYLIFTKSGSQIGVANKKWKYLFAELLNERGAGDGLFPGCDLKRPVRNRLGEHEVNDPPSGGASAPSRGAPRALQ